MKVKLEDGFEVEVKTQQLKKWSFTELLCEAEKNYLKIVDVAKAILSEDQLEELKKHIDKGGDPDADKMIEAVKQILESEELKNM